MIPTTLTQHQQQDAFFFIIVPGILRTYIYQTEDAYYDGYGVACFGLTSKNLAGTASALTKLSRAVASPTF
jgi:hypothetical protein